MIFKDSQSLLFDRFSSFVTDWFHCVIMWRRLDASFLYAAELTEQRRERASNRRHARTVNDWRRRRDVIGRRRHRAQRQGDFFLPCHHDTGTCTHTLQRRLLAAAFTRIVVLSGHGGGCQGHYWYGLFWGCFQGVIEFSLCLFFAKLVSYTFLFWLPTYINHTGASRCGGALFYPSEIWSHPLVVVRSHCQCRVLEFVVFIFSKKLLMMIQAIIDTNTSVKWHVCWHWCTIECARVRHLSMSRLLSTLVSFVRIMVYSCNALQTTIRGRNRRIWRRCLTWAASSARSQPGSSQIAPSRRASSVPAASSSPFLLWVELCWTALKKQPWNYLCADAL